MRSPAILAAPIVMLALDPAAADTITADGRQFELPVPAQHCPLSQDDSVGRLFYEQQRRIQPKTNKLVVFSIQCDQVQLARSGQKIENYAIWLSIRFSVSQYAVPDSFSQEEFLRQLEHAWPRLDTNRIAERVSNRASKVSGVTVGIQNMGVVGTDDNAVYVAIISTIKDRHGAQATLAGMMGQTMIGRRLFSFNSYRTFTGAGVFDDMLAESKQVIAEAHALNRPAVAAKDPSPEAHAPDRPAVAAKDPSPEAHAPVRPAVTAEDPAPEAAAVPRPPGWIGSMSPGWTAGIAGSLVGINIMMIGMVFARSR